MNIVKMMFRKVLGDVYFYSKSLAPCSTERIQRAGASSPIFHRSRAIVRSRLKLKGDELCDDTSNIPIRRNHAYTDGAEERCATSSGAESPSNTARRGSSFLHTRVSRGSRRMRRDVVPSPKHPSLTHEPMKRGGRI